MHEKGAAGLKMKELHESSLANMNGQDNRNDSFLKPQLCFTHTAIMLSSRQICISIVIQIAILASFMVIYTDCKIRAYDCQDGNSTAEFISLKNINNM